jgi:membrane protease YdiL (CAAX protease family)
MLREGLDGDPAPARRVLGLQTTPFTTEHIRPLLASIHRAFPFSLRLFSASRPAAETPRALFAVLLVWLAVSLSTVFGFVSDVWMGLTWAMGLALIIALASKPARAFRPTAFRVAAGLGAGAVLYGLTRVIAALLPSLWPGWETGARALYSWKAGHSWAFLAPTLVMIVIAEEVVWRGVVARFFMERWGRPLGITVGALVYALAHLASLNPLLVLAAFGCGLYWGWLYSATDDLVAPAVSHLLWDSLLLAIPLLR